MNQELLNIKDASRWATEFLKKEVTPSNISYLINYGRIENKGNGGEVKIDKNELLEYYISYNGNREINWRSKLGEDIDWHLSFEQYKESETTKHVHRLHPYKGKFIPQLVEYFLDNHIDEFKKEVYFQKGDIILDPFCGSGTTLVQANELGMHAIGIDISRFNSLITNVKVGKHDLFELKKEIKNITDYLSEFVYGTNVIEFEERLLRELNSFNNKFFPSPEFKRKVRNKEFDEKKYGDEKAALFLSIYNNLVKEYSIQLKQLNQSNFIDKWYLQTVRNEINYVFEGLKQVKNRDIQKVLTIILSRTIRSCRATTHSDLATLVEPITSTYYCSKHGKICKPIFSLLGWWKRYSEDTIKRLADFKKLRTNTFQKCYTDDSRTIDLEKKIKNSDLANVFSKNKIKGIFTSPPYVGLINYHEQHSYAYDLFGFEKNEELEIGPLFKGKGKEARESYIKGVSEVLNNCKKWLADDFDIFIVANDKFNLYPVIAENTGLNIVQQYKRPVLNRTEKDKGAYSEIIFHLKK